MIMPKPSRLLAAAAVFLLAGAPAAQAVDIERVVSPEGIEAWLVTESAVPVVTMSLAFRGGASQDPEDRPGTAQMVAGLLDEGAGELDSQAFQQRLQETHVELSFSARRDTFRGQMRTLAENLDEGFDLLRMALTEPRFDEDAVERRRSQALAGLRRQLQDPRTVASRNWSEAVFGEDHPYGRPVEGTLDSVDEIAIEDLRRFHETKLARDNLVVAVVGDIDAETLAPKLDEVFGGLPESADLTPVPPVDMPERDEEIVVEMDIPQTVMHFGRQGLVRDDDDFLAAYVANHILGGGSFTSRLYQEVREDRGLAYGVYSYLQSLEATGLFLGGVATRNDRAGESLSLIRDEVRRMAREGPTEEELEDAKRYLIGAYPLRFDNSGSIAGQLVQIQLNDLGIDYVNIRNELVEALTIDDVRRAARRLLEDGELLVTLVGQPRGVAESAGDG